MKSTWENLPREANRVEVDAKARQAIAGVNNIWFENRKSASFYKRIEIWNLEGLGKAAVGFLDK